MNRRNFLTNLGIGTAIASFRPDALARIKTAVLSVEGLSPEEAAKDEDFG